jgi:hypothetical protein
MKRCIFCGRTEEELKENNSWSVEHIIPLSLGNTDLITTDVCANCNNKLGQNVDKYFVDNMLIEIKRKELGLKGESGKSPNPFKQGKDQYGNLVRVDNSLNPTLVPKLSVESVEEGLHFKGLANSKDEAKQMVKKSLTRKRYKSEDIDTILLQIDSAETNSYQPIISYSFKFEPNRIALFFLKIAYEYTCLKLGETYWNDPSSVEIREMLYKAICGEMKTICGNCRWVCSTPNEISNLFSEIREKLNVHVIFLHEDKEGKLICEVFLFLEKATSFSIIVSENAEKYMPLPNMDIIEIHTT